VQAPILSPIDPLSIENAGFWLRLGTSVLCGGAIGLERQLRGKAAGIRTSVLICMGTMLFVAIGASFPAARTDPTRVLGQVITGIGFLGAGVIMKENTQILGVTSAATIWVLAGIGAIIGVGRYDAAMIATLATLGVLIGIGALEAMWKRLREAGAAKALEELHIDM
jgi:putative Mg2+ transporter-C (MgtC) family protein